MKEKDLPIDLTKHKVYSRSARKCVLKLLHRYYDEQTAAELREKVRQDIYISALRESVLLRYIWSDFSRIFCWDIKSELVVSRGEVQ